ncbi:MAG: UDP-N-acetylglucosamine--N-acetylmuramyl-(pentapeptide) pyrophosphoryl-undecaprenol N-acetylglucosamine transferase [Candidatus Saccharimonas sp.]
MRVLAAGGGSGGHVTPVVVVINEVAKIESQLTTLFVCDTAFEQQARELVKRNAQVPVEVRTISAGKFRRYSHLSVLRQLLMPSIVLANLRDVARVGRGIWQSLRIIRSFKPDVVFAKGGYVCLPVGIAARLLRVPVVVHDSDARPGLTNSILGRWATAIATGSPLENYHYDKKRATYVGVPISADFSPFSAAQQRRAKQQLGVNPERPLVVATGGGLGAESINVAVMSAARDLLEAGISIYHVTGKAHYDEVRALAPVHDDYQIIPFVYNDMATVLGAADIVISRASATFIQELAGLAKTAILVPSRALGDQRKNADVYKEAAAAVVLTDDEIGKSGLLTETITVLLRDPATRQAYASTLNSFARPDAAKQVAIMIQKAALL